MTKYDVFGILWNWIDSGSEIFVFLDRSICTYTFREKKKPLDSSSLES